MKKMVFRFFVIVGKAFGLYIYWQKHKKASHFHEVFAVKIRQCFEQLGATFIKLGQALSMRPDFIPSGYCIEFEKCLDTADPIPFSDIRQIIEKELGQPISMLFHHINAHPLASASISQVHKAVLKNRDRVIVKVLRPNVDKIIRRDLGIMKLVIKLFGNTIGAMGKKYWLGLIEEVREWLTNETDYDKEQKNIEIMRDMLQQEKDVIFSRVYASLSTKQVLVMEYIEGWSVQELTKRHRKGKLSLVKVSLPVIQKRLEKLINISLEYHIRHGYFHADLHPANIIITPSGKVGIIDLGLIGYSDARLRKKVLKFLIGIAFASPELVLKAGYEMSENITEHYDEKKFFCEISRLCDRYRDAPSKKMSNGEFLVRVIYLSMEHGVQFPWVVALYARTALNMDGMILNLHPDFVFSSHIQQLSIRLYLQNAIDEVLSIPRAISLFDDFWNIVKKTMKGES